MKSFNFLALSLMGCIALFSCDKESNQTHNLEGSWRVTSAEAFFEGDMVFSGAEAARGISSLTFEEGYVTILESGDARQFPYTYSKGIISINAYIFDIQMVVKELSRKELIVEIQVPSYGVEIRGGQVSEFKRKNIYKCYDDTFGDVFFYVANHHAVICEPIDENNYDAGWVDRYRIYLKRQ